MATGESVLRLRINVLHPVKGVALKMQRGREALVDPSAASAARTTFDLTVRVAGRPGGQPNFLGEFTQGPPASRFVYINAGKYAGQADTPWGRRAKIPLTGITRALVDEALHRNSVVAVDIDGRARDGGPAAATVEPLGTGWRVEK
jgi:hypothetical protein